MDSGATENRCNREKNWNLSFMVKKWKKNSNNIITSKSITLSTFKYNFYVSVDIDIFVAFRYWITML